MPKLAIIDWGIGGISIFKLIKKRLGPIPITFLSDTGVTPYGKMTRAGLVSRLNEVISFLKSQGVTHLVIGCNAASTAMPYLVNYGIKIEGVIESAVTETVNLKPKRLAVIGGRRTVLSGVYREAFAENGIKIDQRIAQPLSALIESGDVSSETLRHEAAKILSPIRNSSHILLACTHYPAILPILKNFVSPATQFIDPATALVEAISTWKLGPGGEDHFLTSGDTMQMLKSANVAFGLDIDNVVRVIL